MKKYRNTGDTVAVNGQACVDTDALEATKVVRAGGRGGCVGGGSGNPH